MQSKCYCIIYDKKRPSLTKNDTNIGNSTGAGTIPEMMGRTDRYQVILHSVVECGQG